MMNQAQIRKLSIKFQTSDFNMAQEYCQHIFLSQFYQLSQSKKIFFKGGTALRIVFDSPRFSEDLDFSSNLSIEVLESLLIETLKNMQNFNIKTDIRESKITSGGFLAIFTCEFFDFLIQLRMEISNRKKTKFSGELNAIVSDFLPSYTLMCLNVEQLIDEKIQATLFRQKPRDFFDIYFLLRGRLILPEQKNKLAEIKTLVSKTNINFSGELKKFLPVSFHSIIKNFRQTLIGEIDKNI